MKHAKQNENSATLRTTFLGYLLIFIIGLCFAGFVYWKTEKDSKAVLERYKSASLAEAQQNAASVSYGFKQIYQGIRTISLLPSVKNIDRYATNLDDNARAAIIQIYNNMVSNVAVSEIYIVPVDLEPEKIDPKTLSLETPILMYDGSISDPNEPEAPPITTVTEALNAPEIELPEYRLLKQQMDYLKANYATHSTIKDLELPFIGGPDVLTCDNTDYEASNKDSDRAGIVLSVPFYGPDNLLKGTITAVIRNNLLQQMLPETNAAVINLEYGNIVLPSTTGQETKSLEWVRKGEEDPSLLFSTTVKIETPDPRSEWKLWKGLPNDLFYQSGDLKAVKNFSQAGYVLSLILTLLGGVVWTVLRRSAKIVRLKIIDLEQDVAHKAEENEKLAHEREAQKIEAERQKKIEMKQLADSFESRMSGVISSLSSATSSLKDTSRLMRSASENTSVISSEVSYSSVEASENVQAVATAAEELTASSAEISRQVDSVAAKASLAAGQAQTTSESVNELEQIADSIGEVISAIKDIADQTNLLALNATIEAARAGEAGKGFAVVADEVKKLSSETAVKAEQIDQRVGRIQTAIRESVSAMENIIYNVRQIDEATASVASAVEEQNAATGEIGRSVIEASAGTRSVSAKITEVERNATETMSAADSVLVSAEELAKLSDRLKQEVNEFLKQVRQ